ncbi:MAG TPA: hypothetical protein VF594_12520 [Rubricoccaceae bacterium]|jgi:hypothetical protein
MRLPTRLSHLVLLAPLALTACDTNSDGPPRRAIVTAVQIDDAPLSDPANGDSWDGAGGGGPEVYFRLLYADESPTSPGVLNPRDDAFVVNTFTPGQPWVDDVNGANFPLVWTVDGGFEVRGLDDEYRVVLYDYDPIGGDDVMILTRTFTFAEAAPDIADGREDTIVLDGVGADESLVRVRLRVVYES